LNSKAVIKLWNDKAFYKPYEVIGGRKIMAPSASSFHNNTMGGLYSVIRNYVRKNKCGYVFTDNVDVHLPDGNVFRPDLVVVKSENAGIIDWSKTITGVPDMVVEVISQSTKHNDFNIKKDTYEANGVKEYWIVDPFFKSVMVYLLRDGKYYLEGEYIYFINKEEFDEMPEEEKAKFKSEVTLSIFPDLTINLEDIFEIW